MSNQKNIEARIKRLSATYEMTKGDAERIELYTTRIHKRKQRNPQLEQDRRYVQSMEAKKENIRKPYVSGRTLGKIRRLKKKLEATKA